MKVSVKSIGVVCALALWGCENNTPQPVADTGIEKAKEQSQPSVEETGPQWPFVDVRGNAIEEDGELSSNLLASNIYIVFDASGSMAESDCSGGEPKITSAKRALNEFVKAVPADANIGMVVFDRRGTAERVALTASAASVISGSTNDIRVGGGTPLSTAIDIAYHKLTQQARAQLGYGEYHLVVITDGLASAGFEPDKVLKRVLGKSPVVVHTFGFCIDDRHPLNQPGKTIYKTAQNYQTLRQGLEGVLAEAPEFAVSEFN